MLALALVALSGAIALGSVLTPDPVPGFTVAPYWQAVEGGHATLKFETRRLSGAKIVLDPPPLTRAASHVPAADATATTAQTDVTEQPPAAPAESRPKVSGPVTLPAAAGLRSVTLAGLETGKRYTATITLDDGSRAAAGISPVKEDAKEIRLLVAGDSRRYPDRARSVALAAANENFDLFVHTGDLVNYPGDRSLWQRNFFAPFKTVLARSELVPVMGNHEDASLEFHDYFDLPGNERWYRLARGPVEIISLASDEWIDEGSPQLRWLDGVLADPLRDFRIVVIHRPVAGWAGKDAPGEPGASPLPARLRQHGVQLVLSGHQHLYERNLKLTEPELLYLTVGNAGANWSSGQRERPADVVGRTVFETLGYATVHVSSQSTVVESKDNHGTVLDRCQYERNRWSCPTGQ